MWLFWKSDTKNHETSYLSRFAPICPRKQGSPSLREKGVSPHTVALPLVVGESTKLSTRRLFLKDYINKQGYVNKKKNEVILLKSKNGLFLWGEQQNLRKSWCFFIPERPSPAHSLLKTPGRPLPPLHPPGNAGSCESGLLGFIPDCGLCLRCPKALPNPSHHLPGTLVPIPGIHRTLLLHKPA